MTVRFEWQGTTAIVTIDRPERRNAVDHATLVALRAAQRDAHAANARALVLTGTAPAFCAGADLSGVEDGEFVRALGEVLTGFGALPFACIAAVDGPALGAGTQLAMACDLRVSTPTSKFGIPAAKLGLAIDHWTADRLAREVGPSIARDMLLTASMYTGEQLAPTGFVHRLGDLGVALDWADQIARLAPLTIAAHKLALEASSPAPGFDPAVQAARDRAWTSADAEEGRVAFLEKRPPVFRGE
ncbi:MAG: enoyl-CoA hydratase [Ilumatobacteraceae bacterium]